MLDDGAIDGRDTIVVAKESELVHFMIIAGRYVETCSVANHRGQHDSGTA
jgi:hypothetical protein